MAIYFKNGGQSIARLWHSTSPGIQNSSEQRRYFIICLILLAQGMDPDSPLVVGANRDEFFDQPSAAANFWPGSESSKFAGRDLQAGCS
ncbi:MAG: NRDE family protein [Pseudomonadota bacterium]|nr:NRDE family protein [Pseudomonadota bacterium]